MAKQDRNAYIHRKAQRIANLQKQINEGKDIKSNEEKIQMIMSSLDFEDLIKVFGYIEEKNLVEKI